VVVVATGVVVVVIAGVVVVVIAGVVVVVIACVVVVVIAGAWVDMVVAQPDMLASPIDKIANVTIKPKNDLNLIIMLLTSSPPRNRRLPSLDIRLPGQICYGIRV
jgi:hypothetical protein